ncbi:MAG: glycosyltransferase family 2 protein [Candidatus Altiarchaeota archaeon]
MTDRLKKQMVGGERELKNLPLISLVIVNHNGRDLLEDCLSSIRDLEYPKEKLEIIMVDNISEDDSMSFVSESFPECRIIRSGENNYAKANNIGIRESKGNFVGLLNNDVRVERNWLVELVRVMMSDAKVGVAGGKILFENGRIQSVGHVELGNYYWSDRGFNETDREQYDRVEDVKSLCGAAVLYRRKCLDDVGLFDEDFVMYYEDVDLNLRCGERGWRRVYVPKSVAYHKFRGTATEDTVKKWCERNRLMLIAKKEPNAFLEKLIRTEYYIKQNSKKAEEDLNAILKKWFDSMKDGKNVGSLQQRLLVLLNLSYAELYGRDSGIEKMEEEIKLMNQQLADRNQYIRQKEEQLDRIFNSRGWKSLTAFHDIKKSLGLVKE